MKWFCNECQIPTTIEDGCCSNCAYQCYLRLDPSCFSEVILAATYLDEQARKFADAKGIENYSRLDLLNMNLICEVWGRFAEDHDSWTYPVTYLDLGRTDAEYTLMKQERLNLEAEVKAAAEKAKIERNRKEAEELLAAAREQVSKLERLLS